MKNKAFQSLTLIACLFAMNASLSAQIQNTWKGGAPGHETDWNHYKNWSLGKTPNEFHKVLIPDVSTGSRKYPVIQSGRMEVLTLEIQSGASLTLNAGAEMITTALDGNGICQGCHVRLLLMGEQQAMRATATADPD